MDTSDPNINFDAAGICNHCHAYDAAVASRVVTGTAAEIALHELAGRIQRDGKGKRYDCVIGVSGGVDSTYVAYKVKQLGLRPLAVHLDNGWDSELAVKNIENVLKHLEIELHTHVLDWEEFKDLQLAFLRASTPDSEIPTDHAIVALLRRTAARIGVHYVIAGVNVRTESHLPGAWSQGHLDWRYIKAVHTLFGSGSLKSFPRLSVVDQYRFRFTQTWVDILNYVDYDKQQAKAILHDELGWRDYGGKHYESIYTRFYQGYILLRKFGYDKRRSHLSSLICSGQTSRMQALKDLQSEPYPLEAQESDRKYVIKKFGLTDAEFEKIMRLPAKSYFDYPSYASFYRSRTYRLLRSLYHLMRGTGRRRPAASAALPDDGKTI
jgi:N-acetyl sugar amidotransferase